MMRKLLILLVCAIICFQSMQVMAAQPLGTLECLESSNPDYIFSLKGSGKRFLLLDILDDPEGKFFLMGIDYYGQGAFDEFSKQRLDVEQVGNAAYKLNNLLIGDGIANNFTKKAYNIPDEVVDYIDFNHVWQTKGSGNSKGNAKNDYTTVCGVNLLSQDEFVKYQSRIGTYDNLFEKKDSPNGSGWWLRDGDSSGINMLAVRKGEKPWIGVWAANDTNLLYRPVFYVSRDFFGKVPIDLKSAGKNIKEIFKTYYTVGELAKMYKETDIYNYLDYKPNITVGVQRFTNGETDITKINDARKLYANVSLTNNQVFEQHGTLVMTHYDCYGRAKQVDSKKIDISAQETQMHALELYLNEIPDEGSYVKITFIGDRINTQTCNSIRFYYE